MKPNYEYQINVKRQIKRALAEHGKVVLATSCGGGKTKMAMDVVSDHFRDGGKKALWLAHNQKELRRQTALAYENSDFAYTYTELGVEGQDVNAQVHISLPAVAAKLGHKYDLIVIDEAHHYYTGKSISDILELNNKSKQLLLTASHGFFTRNHWPVKTISMMELWQNGVIMAPRVELATTDQHFRNATDFDSEGDLKTSVKLKKLDKSMRQIMSKVAGRFQTGKHMIACHNQDAADKITLILQKQGIEAVISTSDTDPDGKEIVAFRTDPAVTVMVVVYRGIIGFDMPSLSTVVDMSCSQNCDRLFQLMNRCVRFKKGKEPLYVKLAPTEHAGWFTYVTAGVMWLAVPENYKRYDGRVGSIRVPKAMLETDKPILKKGKKVYKNHKVKIPTFEEILNVFEEGDTVLGDGYWTTLDHVKKLYDADSSANKKEELLELAKSGASRPSEGKHPLGRALSYYTKPSSSSYDPKFDKLIRKLRPDWFENTADLKKVELIKLAKSGAKRPAWSKHPLGVALMCYTNPTQCSYDPKFDKLIRKLRPDWFENTADLKKVELIKLAKSGGEKASSFRVEQNFSRGSVDSLHKSNSM